MEKGYYVNELTPGMRFSGSIFVLKHVALKEETNGPKACFTLADAQGSRKAKMWTPTPEEKRVLQTPGFVRVCGSVDASSKYRGELSIDTLEAVEIAGESLRCFLEKPRKVAANRERFVQIVKSIREPNLYRLLKAVFSPHTYGQFGEAVAATHHHHAFRGGLLEHTVEVAELCAQVCTVLPYLRRDFLVAGALLHDIGKLDEMEHGLLAGEYTMQGNLHGHLLSGARRVDRAVAKLADFPDDLLNALVHLVASHHGAPDYGAIKTPGMAEAFVLHHCDQISAQGFACQSAKEKAQPGQAFVQTLNGKVFVGDLPLQAALLASEEPIAPLWLENQFATATVRLPVLGRVAAGTGEQSSDEPEEFRDVVLPQAGADFLLRVVGDSMIGAQISEGDLLFVRKTEEARSGEIVVAHVPGSGPVVKRFHVADGQAQLVSENPNYAPIAMNEGVCVQGKVTGLFREML